MRGSALSNMGKIRKSNQDAFLLLPHLNLLAVADGMGGHLAGDVASNEAIRVLENYVLNHQGIAEEVLHEAFNEANLKIFEQANSDTIYAGMGTTLTAALVFDGRLIIAHVGDSRAYLLQDGEFFQLTNDHSLVGELMRNGNITSQEADTHPNKNILTRALGMAPTIDVDIRVFEVEPQSKIFLCSDGLTNMLTKEEIFKVIAANEPQPAAETLIAMAMEKGGIDNITAVIAVVEGEA